MQSFIALFFDFFVFWFFQAPKGLIGYFASLNKSFLRMFSFPVLLRTYFKPWKNEYRQGLIGFSLFMGIFVKTWILLFTLPILLVFILIEVAVVIAFIAWPAATIAVLFL